MKTFLGWLGHHVLDLLGIGRVEEDEEWRIVDVRYSEWTRETVLARVR